MSSFIISIIFFCQVQSHQKGWSSFCSFFFLIFIHQRFHEIFPKVSYLKVLHPAVALPIKFRGRSIFGSYYKIALGQLVSLYLVI